MRTLLILFAFFTFFTESIAQTELVAKASSYEVEAGSLISVSFEFSGTKDASKFKAPDFSPFKLYSGPSTSRSVTIINGLRSNNLTYSYTLMAPQKDGTYTIGQASIQSGGKTYTSSNLRIKVKPLDPQSAKDRDAEVFLELTLSKDTAYVGEGVLCEAIIYYRNYNIEIGNALQSLNFENFKQEYIPDVGFGRRNVQIVNGQEYFFKVLHRSKIYPQKTGKVDIGTLILTVNQILSVGYSTSVRPIQLKSQALELVVLDLPKPYPPDFVGAVGKYKVDFKVSKNKISTGQGFFIHTIIEGDGDVDRVSAPVFNFPSSVEIYEPKSQEQKHFQSENIVSEKIFEHFCMTNVPDQITIEPSVSFFDTELKEYVQIKNKINIDVVGESTSLDDSVLYDGPSSSATNSSKNKWVWLLIGSISLLVAVLFLRKNQKNAFDNFKEPVILSKTRDQRLKQAEILKNNNESKAFYDEIFRLWNDFVVHQCKIEQAEINRVTLKNALLQAEVSNDNVQRLETVLNTCDMALFADLDMKDKMELVLEESEFLLEALDLHFQ